MYGSAVSITANGRTMPARNSEPSPHFWAFCRFLGQFNRALCFWTAADTKKAGPRAGLTCKEKGRIAELSKHTVLAQNPQHARAKRQ